MTIDARSPQRLSMLSWLSWLSPVLWLSITIMVMLAMRSLGTRTVSSPIGGPATGPVSSPVARIQTGCLETGDGYLRMRLRSTDAPDQEVDWKNADMQCEGGLRPGGAGMRMVFAGPLNDGHRLRVVFGVAADAGVIVARDVPTNVTVIYEDEQKVFSTAGDNKCTMDTLTLQEPADNRHKHFLARGFCTAAATRVPDGKALLVDRFDFLGVVFDENAQ
jgi:hypothetical protein